MGYKCAVANGDVYDGYWLNDKKEGPGRFYYKASGKMYEGEWVDGAPKCGTYHDADEAHALAQTEGSGGGRLNRFQLPEVSRLVALQVTHYVAVAGLADSRFVA